MTHSALPARVAPAAFRRIGLVTSALVVVISLALISPLDPSTFTGVVSFVALCCIPVQIAMATYLQGRPSALAGWPRAARGGVLLVVNLLLGAAAAVVIQFVIADGWGTDFPGLSMFCILAVVIALWLSQVCQGWPFHRISNPLLRAVAMLLAAYVLTYLIYRFLFSFDAFGLPAGVGLRPAPSGLFEAWHVLTFLVTAISGMFLAPAFRFTGLPQHAAARAGINTVACLLWAVLLFGVGVSVLGVDVVTFLVWVPVPVLFGGLIVIKMCRGACYPDRPSGVVPNGVATLATAIATGVVLVWLYGAAATLVHPDMPWGAPTYVGQVWVASAALAFTFPLLNVAADFFDFWPFGRTAATPNP